MFAVIHVPGFPLQAILRSEAGLSAQPVVLRHPTETVVEICSRAAHRAGIRAGQPLPQAAARCPSVIVRSPDAELEREAESVLLAAAFAVCPQVELTRAGVCTLDLGGLAQTSREPALRRALAELAAGGIEAGAGIAATPLLALYTACEAQPGAVLAGSRIFLSPLPVSVAMSTPEQSGILRQWGIKTLGQLVALAKADVTRRLGRSGLDLWERANGGTTRPLQIHALPQDFTARYDSEHALETLEPLLFIFRRFVDRLALELRNASLAAQAMELTLDLVDDSSHAHFIRLPEPVSDAEILFCALHAYLETLRTAAAIQRVCLRILPERSLVRQRGLFDGGLRDPHGFADTLARLMALVGSDRVGTPVPENTHRPDAFVLISPPATLAPLPEDFRHRPRGLALRRHRPPLPATVELHGRQPAYVWAPGLQGGIHAVAGPWHGSGDWWEKDRNWQREEWDVELTCGGVYRLVRTPAGWLVEGEYD